tara:strand:- start:12347 stop:12850 length:504 start_codon:yes stop_codon:yes gene_type:complete
MRLTKNLIFDVVSEVVGNDVVPLVKLLDPKKDISEIRLAKKIGVEVNIIRGMLYRLYYNNLVCCSKRKDMKTGWYVYHWYLNAKRVKDMFKRVRVDKINKLKERLKREESEQFFNCGDQCIRLNFDQAIDFKFQCPECGLLIEMENNMPKIDKLKKTINVLELELKK